MKVKICGITRLQDAMDAVEMGSSAVVFVFAPSSPRYIPPQEAAAIVRRLPSHVAAVGVVVNLPRAELQRIVVESSVTALQFHGDELPEELLGYPVPTYKAFRVGEQFDIDDVRKYPGDTFLLDTGVPGKLGGTGATFDWRIAQSARTMGRLILAGGITERNVSRVVSDVRPWAIDVSSGVERSPGIKDKDKIARLFAEISTTCGFNELTPMI